MPLATGRNPENASVAVTAGSAGRLNRDELQGVIAHEISHIIYRDILFVTMAGVMLGDRTYQRSIFPQYVLWGNGPATLFIVRRNTAEHRP